MNKKAALIILDGWGIGEKNEYDGVYLANTPTYDKLILDNPNAVLKTFGENVGLPKGQMGNSEVGHINIGAGRIIYQDLLKINRAIENKSFFNNSTILKAIEYANKHKKKMHIMGLVSNGGVHSSLQHLLALCSIMKEKCNRSVFIHGFTDGRDCSPTSGLPAFTELSSNIEGTNIQIATIIGRYYAMDRDQRWNRIKKAYDLLVEGEGEVYDNFQDAFQENYHKGITDEFLNPIKIKGIDGNFQKGDVVICFNFRTDRCRQITTALTQLNFIEHQMEKLDLEYYTMTNYDKSFKRVNVIYDKENILMTLGEVISKEGKRQLRIAETEKYPHVTYFFNGGREREFEGEERIMINSPKVSTYDLQPEMSAQEVTDQAILYVKENNPSFICLNFANPDMVGHTGVPKAIIKACEKVDNCLSKLVYHLKQSNYSIVIIADHGNADKMQNADGSVHTAHTVNLVPVIVLDDNVKEINNGILADVAPTILSLMNIGKPNEMTGKSLISIN